MEEQSTAILTGGRQGIALTLEKQLRLYCLGQRFVSLLEPQMFSRSHPAMQLNGRSVADSVIEVSTIHLGSDPGAAPGPIDTIKLTIRSAESREPQYLFQFYAPRTDFSDPAFTDRVLKVIELGVTERLRCRICGVGMLDSFTFLESGVTIHCQKCGQWSRIPELQKTAIDE
jgi:hypothetical protein